MSTEFTSTNTSPLTKQDIINAAKELQCEPSAIRAVSMVESNGNGFITDTKAIYKDCPIILFESHSFHTLTKGKYDASNPGISTPTWVHNYGASGDHQYNRLIEAIALDRVAALESASWGKFQILGSNFYNTGYDNVEDFIRGMVDSEASQLDAFVCFIQNTNLDRYLQNKDWTHFTIGYNGSGQVEFYSQKIQQAYDRSVKDGFNK